MSGKHGNRGGGRAWKRIAILSLAINVGVGLWLLLASQGSESEEVGYFIEEYFRTWSDRDLAAYGACFHPRATIYFVDDEGLPQGSGLEPFLQSQAEVQRMAKSPMREVPTAVEIEIDGNIARVRARWKLFKDEGEEVGTDYFTLLKTKSGWRILNLIFRKD
ncbi:MAG: nuclear transport factor 2 family protein [Verrucomicrobiales bacterium]